jgi:short subunit dehydrogenase-like uncharacterized protein
MSRWLLYGATGYTGRLIINEALARGHRPVLAGRSAAKLAPLAQPHNLEWRAFGLDDPDHLRDTVAEFDLVFHAAGPFIHTSEPMLQACLAGKTHYLDITGEIPVFENTLSYDTHAQEQGIALISGVGFDILPTDSLARYVANQVPNAAELEIAFHGDFRVSAGTTKSFLEMLARLPQGSLVRRNGRLVDYRLGKGGKQVRFSDGKTRRVIPIPWGDLATAEKSTGIPNVTAYMALPLPPGARRVAPLLMRAIGLEPVRGLARRAADLAMSGPDEKLRAAGRSYIWARAANGAGAAREAWLETMEPYRLTAVAAVRCVERVLEIQPRGALTPALAFGPNFILELPETQRFDTIDD